MRPPVILFRRFGFLRLAPSALAPLLLLPLLVGVHAPMDRLYGRKVLNSG